MKGIDLKTLKGWQIDAAGGVVCALLVLSLYLLGIAPVSGRQERVEARQEELLTQRHQADRLARLRMGLEEQLAQVRASVAQFRLELLPVGQVNRRLAELSDLASKTGLKIDGIEPGGAVGGTRYEMVPITVAGKGTFTNCVGFLHQLRSRLPDTGVSALELTGNPSEPTAPAGFRFELLWYAAPRSSS